MAGLPKGQVIVDVVAASEKLRPSTPPRELPTNPPVPLEVVPLVPTEIAEFAAPAEEFTRCIFGHQAHQDFRFCPTCGAPMDAEVVPAGVPARPKPAGMLSPAEQAERERRHAEAVAAAAQFENAPQSFVPSEGQAVLIHFVADGLTAFGQVWYRGQELEIGPDHPRWREARGWITLNRFAQVERWGEQKFDSGPWPGRRSYAEAAGGFEPIMVTGPDGTRHQYAGPGEAELRAADEAEARRGRAVPAPVF